MRNETLMFVAGALIATCTTVGAYAQGGQTCAAAVTISDGVTAYNNAGATVDMDYTGLCDMGQFGTETNFNTVWFQWTATTTDTYTFSTCGTAGSSIHVSQLKLAAMRRQSLHAMMTARVALRFRAS